jgi:mannose-P-dolichol utilization defect protein 1
MTSITRNLPGFVKDLGISIIGQVRTLAHHYFYRVSHPTVTVTQKCYVSLVENLNIEDVDCIKYSLSKGIGVGVVVGGSIMKVPQLLLSALLPLRPFFGLTFSQSFGPNLRGASP